MTPEDRRHAAEVDRYWDAWVLTGRPLETDSVDPTTRDLIDRLWAVGVPPQIAEARTRVRQRLHHASEEEEDRMNTTTRPAMRRLTQGSPAHANGRIDARPALPTIRPWWRGISGPVVTAALVVLVLMAGLFAGGPLRPNREGTEHAALPAGMTAPATPGPAEAVRESIVTTTVAPEDLPDGPRLKFEIWHATIEPEVEATMEAAASSGSPGSRIEHVVAGTLTLRVDGALQVVRAGSGETPLPTEEVTPGTEVVLQAGDTALFAQKLAMTYANRGTDPVRIIGGQLLEMEGMFGTFPAGYTVNVTDERDLTEGLDTVPMTFELERVTLAPGAVLPAPPDGGLRVMTSGPSVVYLAKGSDGSVSNVLKEPVVTYALTLRPAGSVAGTPAATPNATG